MASLAKWLNVRLRARWLWIRISLLWLKLQIWHLLETRSSLSFRQTIKCRFTLKLLGDMIIIYSQMHRADKYSQHCSIIWPVWLNGSVFVYELSGYGFESSCGYLNFRFRSYFEQGFPWHPGNYRVWIYSETRTWHDNNILSAGNQCVIVFLTYCNFSNTIVWY